MMTEVLKAQEFTGSDTSTSLLPKYSNSISIGGALSANSLFQKRGRGFGSAISFDYAHKFSDIVGIQVNSYYLDMSNDRPNLFFSLLTTSLTNSANITLSPFTTTPITFVLGGVFRWYSSLEENISFPMINLPRIHYVDAMQFGVNAQVEYIFPVHQNIDIGLRGQGQLFFQPFSFISNADFSKISPFLNPALTSSLNLGAFLRINF
jgi:hypothetical protein